jgi:hypothetical protein
MPYVIKAVNPKNTKDVLIGTAYQTIRQAQHALLQDAIETLALRAIFGSPVVVQHPLKFISRVRGQQAPNVNNLANERIT